MVSRTKAKRSPGRPKGAAGGVAMRDKILLTASVLFMELGYEPVSINMIAERAGVTKASVYYYYSNKAVLFTKSVSEMMKRICNRTIALLEQHHGIKEQLEQIAISKLSRTHVDFESLMREAIAYLTAEQREEIRAAERSIHDALAGSFEAAMERGLIVRSDPLLLSHAFSAFLMVGNRERGPVGDMPSEELARTIVELFWNGIGPREAT